MEVKPLVATLDLVTKTDPELLRKVFDHRITENRLSIFNSNGSIRKCQKSKLIQAMEQKPVSIPNYISSEDLRLHPQLIKIKTMEHATSGKIMQTKFSI